MDDGKLFVGTGAFKSMGEEVCIQYSNWKLLDMDGVEVEDFAMSAEELIWYNSKKRVGPQTGGFWEKFFFKPGNLGYPVFQTKYAKVGVYICYDRHFPDGARCLGLNGAEIVYNPSATTVGQSQNLWKLEQPAHAVANGYFMGCINRVGIEKPWNLGRFYGTSYFVNPLGEIFACASEDKDELLVAEFDLDLIEQIRSKWQFYRDRRPETYGEITTP
jgi:N-carbamoylputrescine amidase